uniref:Ubiquitin-like protease family profile domain-containing protein n=1 Tax=Globodera rostochiensis TaxID=31243 RepID=A0A914HTE5_GLORO
MMSSILPMLLLWVLLVVRRQLLLSNYELLLLVHLMATNCSILLWKKTSRLILTSLPTLRFSQTVIFCNSSKQNHSPSSTGQFINAYIFFCWVLLEWKGKLFQGKLKWREKAAFWTFRRARRQQFSKMAQGKAKVELANVLSKSVADDKKLDFDVTPSTSAPNALVALQKAEHRNVLGESATDDKKPLLTVAQPSFSFVTTRRGVKRLLLSDSISPVENKENIEKNHSSDTLNNNDNKELLQVSRPDQEMELPDHFIQSNFWSELRSDKRLRSGKSGEWVKGQDERLTIDGLLCLSDGEWLNADIIDSYLDHLCQQSAGMAQFIPTYAILSYERKGTVPSEWYWRLNGTDIVFAPAHLYTNHWAMVVVNIRERKLTLMDSMNHEFTSSDKTIFMDTIMDVASLQEAHIGDRETWEVSERLSVPQQNNGTDCGIFALLFAKYSLERREFDFEQRHIPYFRRRICHDIISAILHDQQTPTKNSDDKSEQCQIVS